jgi:hypothetical protein
MGLYAVDNPGRAGFDVAKFDGWKMYAIINHFVANENLETENARMELRRALLISDEYAMIARRERFSV